MSRAPVFIFCSASSGSTLLSTIINRGSCLRIGPEMTILCKAAVFDDFKRYSLAERWLKHGLADRGANLETAFFTNRSFYGVNGSSAKALMQAPDLAQSFRSIMDQTFGPNQRWGEKTGSNAYCWRQIAQVWPDAIFVHLTRHPLDAIPSISKRGNNPIGAASHWLYNNSAALAASRHRHYVHIRFEDLLLNPQKTIQELCHKIDIRFSPSMIESTELGQWDGHTESNFHNTWTSRPDRAIDASVIGTNRKTLSQQHIAQIASTTLTRCSARQLGCRPWSINKLATIFGYHLEAESNASAGTTLWRLGDYRQEFTRRIQVMRRLKILRSPLVAVSKRPSPPC